MSTAVHVRDKETEAQRSKNSYPGHLAGKWWRWNLNPGILPSDSIWRENTDLRGERWFVQVTCVMKTLAVTCLFAEPLRLPAPTQSPLLLNVPLTLFQQGFLIICMYVYFIMIKHLYVIFDRRAFFIPSLKHYWEIISATSVKNNGAPSEKTVSETLGS